MRELHREGKQDTELKPLKSKTGERDETVGSARACVCVRMWVGGWGHNRNGVAVSLSDVTGFPHRVKTTVGCGKRKLRGNPFDVSANDYFCVGS